MLTPTRDDDIDIAAGASCRLVVPEVAEEEVGKRCPVA